MMLATPLGLALAYLLVGLLACLVARRGWPEDWDETLLASLLGPPLLVLIASVAAATLMWGRLRDTRSLYLRHTSGS